MFGTLPWDFRIVLDFFFGGIGVGAFLFAVFLYFYNKKENMSMIKIGALLGPALVIAGDIFLLFEVGKPIRAVFYGPTLLHTTSVLSWGIIVQISFILFSSLIVYGLWIKKKERASGGLILFTSALAVFTTFYHGLLLTSTARVAWNGIVPLIFFVCSISSGVFLVLSVDYLYNRKVKKHLDTGLNLFIVLLLLLQFMALFCWKYSLSLSGTDGQKIDQVFYENCSWYWYLIVYLVGIVIPILFSLREWFIKNRPLSKIATWVCSLMVLLGVLTAKGVILFVGQF